MVSVSPGCAVKVITGRMVFTGGDGDGLVTVFGLPCTLGAERPEADNLPLTYAEIGQVCECLPLSDGGSVEDRNAVKWSCE